MDVSTPSSDPDMYTDSARNVHRPNMFRRRFECGHPDEFIETRQSEDGDQIHNLVTFEVFQDISRSLGKLPTYLHARCLTCAKVAKEQDDMDPNVRRKATLGTYQALCSSAMKTKSGETWLMGFKGLLNRHRLSNYQTTAVQPHDRIAEIEHQAHRLDMQAQAVKCAGKWLAVPARRVWNMPVQIEAAARSADDLQVMRHANDIEDTKCSTKSDRYAVEDANEVRERCIESSRTTIHKDEDENFRKAAAATLSLSGSKLRRWEVGFNTIAKPDTVDPEPINTISALLDQERGARRPRYVAGGDLPCRNSISRDSHASQFMSLPVALSGMSPTTQSFGQPRHVSAMSLALMSPRKNALESVRHRNSTSIKKLSKSEPVSMNFRKLGIDVHAARSIRETDLDSNSPDWACQTSLAVEAGRISMDSVSKQNRGLEGLKRTPEATPSLDARRNTYPLPPGHRSRASPRYVRHSEGAPHDLRASAARKCGALLGMEIASPLKETSRHGSAQIVLAMDLNKSLPALPKDIDGQHSV